MILIIFSLFENIEFSTSSSAIGYSHYGIYDQVSSHNPALTGINNFVVAFDYRKLYGVADMGRFYMAFKNAGFSLNYRNIEELQKEGVASLIFGIGLKDARLGFKIKGFYLYQKDFGNDYSFGVDIGFQTKLWRLWNLGFILSNLNKPSFGKDYIYNIKPKIGFGLSYEPSQYFITSFGFEKEMEKDVRFLYGNILKISEILQLQAGFHSSPFEPSFGIKILTKFISFNFAFIYNNELPSNYSIGVEYK